MNQENDVSYYRRREAAARTMAAGCRDQAIARIHSDMADRYAAKVNQAIFRPMLTSA